MNLVPCRFFFSLAIQVLANEKRQRQRKSIYLLLGGFLSTVGPVGRSERTCMRIKTEWRNKKRALGGAADSGHQVLLLSGRWGGAKRQILRCAK